MPPTTRYWWLRRSRRSPPALIEQLEPGGRLVLPLGAPKAGQTLTLIEKTTAGRAHRRPILPVAFVPFRALERPQPGSRSE
ncbi:MAG: hypothetical protein ACREXX_04075 [Gammaproteobacteria bacterium]